MVDGGAFSSRREGRVKNYFIACSYRDYEIANQGEVPERWIKTYNKFS